MEFRCVGTLYGKIVDGFLEVKCHQKRCGYEKGLVLLHRFSLETGNLVETQKFRDVPVPQEEVK